MAVQVITNARIVVQWFDLALALNQVEISPSVDLKSAGAFGNSTKRRVAGLYDTQVKVSGFLEYASVQTEQVLAYDLITAASPSDFAIAVCPGPGTVPGEVAYITTTKQGSFSAPQQHGEMALLSAEFGGSDRLVRGAVLAAGNASVTGTAVQLGAVTASQKIYVLLQQLGINGLSTALDVDIQSCASSGFGSGVTTRFSAVHLESNGPRVVWTSLAGAITDTYWRAVVTVTNGPSTFLISGGVA